MLEHRAAKGPVHNFLPVSIKKYRPTQTSPSLLQNLSARGWRMSPCSPTVEITSHNQPKQVPAQDTADGVHNSPAAETPFATKPMVKGAEGTHQPSASLAHSHCDIGLVGSPGSAHRFPVISFPFMLFRLNAPATISHPSGKDYLTGGAERQQNRMDCAKK